MNEDSLLREQFASLRRADEASTPSFEGVIGLTRRRPNRGSWGLAVAASVAAVVTVVMIRLPHPHRSAALDRAAPVLADWHSPTDFLLDTPGRELLHTIPDIGRYPSTRLGPLPSTRSITPARRAGPEHS